jgi:hypothetical protein
VHNKLPLSSSIYIHTNPNCHLIRQRQHHQQHQQQQQQQQQTNSEKHLEKKIDDLVLEAKAKIAKNDKKGKIVFIV